MRPLPPHRKSQRERLNWVRGPSIAPGWINLDRNAVEAAGEPSSWRSPGRSSTTPQPLRRAAKDWLTGGRALMRLGRPLFLVSGFVFYALGAAVAAAHGSPINPALYLLGQAAVILFQFMTHYANDYFDYEADCANTTPTRWSGGSRVLVEGELARGVALGAALALATLGLGALLVLAGKEEASPLAILALVAVLILSWEYSAPPLRLHSSGLGEFTVVAVVTALVPFFGFSLQAADLVGARVLALAVLPLCCLQFAMMVAIEFPDAAGDRAVGKCTLVVRLGADRAMRLYVVTVATAYASLPVLVAVGLPSAIALAAALPAPVALWRISRMCAGDFRRPECWESLAFWSVALLIGTALAELVGILFLF